MLWALGCPTLGNSSQIAQSGQNMPVLCPRNSVCLCVHDLLTLLCRKVANPRHAANPWCRVCNETSMSRVFCLCVFEFVITVTKRTRVLCDDLWQDVFATVCAPKSKLDTLHSQQSQRDKVGKKKKRKTIDSGENFMPYRPVDYQSEQG